MDKDYMFVFSADELEKEGIEDAYDGEVKCRGCNWRVSELFVLAKTREEALQKIKNGEAGLCGECMSEMIAEEGWGIC